MKQVIIYNIVLVAVMLLAGCREPAGEVIDADPMPIERIDLLVTTFQARTDSMEELQPGLDIYLSIMQPEIFDRDSAIVALHNSKVTQVFGHDIMERFAFPDTLQRRLGMVRKQLQNEFPDIKLGHVYGIASPYRQSVIISDSIAFVALNHYLGQDYAGYNSMPQDVKMLKKPYRIPIDIAEAMISTNYPYVPKESTLLEEMLYRGAIAVSLDKVTGGSYNTADLLHLSDMQYQQLVNNDAKQWKQIIEGGKLYEINSEPASTVSYYGYKIMDSYLKNNPDTPISQLLMPQFYHDALNVLIASRVK